MAQLVVNPSDCMSNSSAATFNYGDYTPLQVHNGTAKRSFYRADISAIPPGSTITRVQFSRYVSSIGTAGLTHTSARVLRAMLTGTGNAAASGDGVTHNTYDGVNGWTTVGCEGVGTDRTDPASDGWTQTNASDGADAVGIFIVDSNTKGAMLTFMQLTLDSYSGIARWVEYRAAGGIGAKVYASQEYATPANRPVLTIDYTLPSSGDAGTTGAISGSLSRLGRLCRVARR